MKLTNKGRYAVMALVDLARFNNINPVSLRDISLRQGISLDYLEQIFSKLRKKEIVQSVRGNQGGYVLNKKAKEIKLTNIFDTARLFKVTICSDAVKLLGAGFSFKIVVMDGIK